MRNNLPMLRYIYNYSLGILKNVYRKDIRFYSEEKYTSALYISGRQAYNVFAFLSPYLDFDNRFRDINKLQTEITLRGLNMNAVEMKKTWEFYKNVKENELYLESKEKELKVSLSKLLKKAERTPKEESELRALEVQVKVLRHDVKIIKETLWDLDESIVVDLLKMPNDLDERTPEKLPGVIKRFGTVNDVSDAERKSHIEIGRTLGLLEYRDPIQCYMCNEAVLFEVGALNLAAKIYRDNNMIRVAGSDFSRSLVIEGCGLNYENPIDTFILQSKKENFVGHMHLVGGASLISFLALHTRQSINPKYFPLKYFSTGKQYTPISRGVEDLGLFTVCQSSVVQVFTIVKDMKNDEYKTQFENLLETTCKLYDNICEHYQVVVRPASELRPWESMRVSFELWSPFIKQYVEVGHISTCGEYFSKRLLIVYETPEGKQFPAVITGTVLSVPRLLACSLEQHPNKFKISPKIAEHVPLNATMSQA